MGKLHIKRIAAPKTWPIQRKTSKWIIRPSPGPQGLEYSMPLGVILKEILNYSNTTKETKYILNAGEVSVNGIIRKSQKFPVGVMDVITAGEDNFRLILNQKRKLSIVKITASEGKLNPKKVRSRTSIKGKKIQINFSDGSNLISNDKYSTGDTVVFSDKKVKEHIKFEKGTMIYILGGKQAGKIGVIKEILPKKDLQKTKIIFTQGKQDFETLKEYAFVIGKTKPIITLSNE